MISKDQINGIAYIKGGEIKLISFITEKEIPFNLKSQKKLDVVRSRFSKKNLLLCNFFCVRENVDIHPIHFVQLATANKSFDICKLKTDEIVTLAYKGAILLTKSKNEKSEDNLTDENADADEIVSGFDSLFQ